MPTETYTFLGYQDGLGLIFLTGSVLLLLTYRFRFKKFAWYSVPVLLWFAFCWLVKLPTTSLMVASGLVLLLCYGVHKWRFSKKPPMADLNHRRSVRLFNGLMIFLGSVAVLTQLMFVKRLTITESEFKEWSPKNRNTLNRNHLKVDISTIKRNGYRFWYFSSDKQEIVLDDNGVYMDNHGQWITTAQLAQHLIKWGHVEPTHSDFEIAIKN